MLLSPAVPIDAFVMGNYVQVRCCCDPGRLLGWVPLPFGARREPGVLVSFKLPIVLEWRPLPESPVVRDPGVVQLELAEYAQGEERGLAFKSNDLPLEQLQAIPGFITHES